MANKFKNRRKNYFIKKRFQRNFIVKFCILVIIGSVISGAIVYTMSRSTVTTTFENCRLRIKSTADFILPAVMLSGAVVIAVIGLATVAVTLFTSHKVAGPLYRMEQDVKEVASGNLKKRFNLRINDEIKTLAESLDKMTRELRTNIAGIKRDVSELELALKTAAEVPEQAKEKLQNLKRTLAKFDT